MNAKQAEAATGISRRNLRFYEQQGLIQPHRNPENDYREYSQKDIEDLKLIRTLRMLDVPLEDIGACLKGSMTLAEVSEAQEKRLQKKQQEVETALRFCRELGKQNGSIDTLLSKMEQPDTEHQLFDGWKRDYLQVEKAESLKSFCFTPDEGITNAREFTTALCRYGEENDLDLVITKEGMYPEFTIDGIAYTAERVYQAMGYVPVPVAVVHCTALNPELLEPDMPKTRRIALQIVRNWWIALVIMAPALIACICLKSTFWEAALILASEFALLAAFFRTYKSNRS